MSIITKTIGQDLPNGDYIEITVEERDGSTGLSAGFSIVGALWEARQRYSGRGRKRGGHDANMYGQIHDVIEGALPHLKPILDVHLADQSGLPMWAKENGWYFYSGKAAAWERKQVERDGLSGYYARLLETSDHNRAAQALHIPPADLPTGLDKEGFEVFVDSLTERYATSAAKARAAMAALVDGQGVEQSQ